MRTPQALMAAAVVLLAPLPVGGYQAWLLPVALALAGFALLLELSRAPASGVRADGYPWLVFWVVVAGYGIAQTGWLYATRDVSFYLPGAAAGLEFSVIDVGRALTFMLRLILYAALAFTVARMSTGGRDIVLLVVVLSAAFQSLYGLLNHAAGNPSILGIWEPGMHTDSVMGTFYSRNQLAGYLALALPLGLAWIWRRHSRAAPRTTPRLLWLWLAILYAVLVAVALIGSGSRLGVVAALAGLLVWASLSARGGSDVVGVASARLFIWFAVILALLAVLWFGADVITGRYLLLSADDARFTIWSTMLAMPIEVWLGGIGPGQFIDVFKLYQGASLPGVYWRALNDPLQFVLEYGLVGTAISLLALAWWLKRSLPSRLDGLQRAALAGVAAMLLHSLGDFDLRVPGTAVLFWVAIGIILRRERRFQQPVGFGRS